MVERCAKYSIELNTTSIYEREYHELYSTKLKMRLDYDKIYNLLAENESIIKDVLDTTKVFASVAGVYLVNTVGSSLSNVTQGMDLTIKSIQLASSIAGFIYIVYKIVEIHTRYKRDKKNQNENKIFGRNKKD